MKKIHQHLINSSGFYRCWHESPTYSAFHWILFLFVALLVTSSLSGVIARYSTSNLAQVSSTSGNAEPVPSGTFMIDTRAGGAQSWQTKTDIAGINAGNDPGSYYAVPFFVPDIDGAGTVARGIQWQNNVGQEQGATLTFPNGYHFATGSEWVYYQGKYIFGKTAQGGGSGTIGQYSFAPSQGSKLILLLRGKTSPGGGNPERIYLVTRAGSSQLSIDQNNWSSSNFSEHLLSGLGTTKQITIGVQGSTGSVKAWVNGVLVLNQTGQPIGDVTFDGVQITATTFPAQQQVQYDWDHVIWKSGSGGTTPPPAPTSTPTPATSVGNGTGLLGEYFSDMNLQNRVFTRTDGTINFNWAQGSPDSRIGIDRFSTRWTGEVQPRYTGTYTFHTQSDDGVRLWVNNQQIINNWTDHGSTENTGTISLTAGQKYSIKMEYYENAIDAVATLSWSSSSLAKEIIPQTQLYPANAPAPSATPTPTPTPAPTPAPTGNNPAPQSGDTILFDTRAGGAQDFQAMTTIAQMKAIFGERMTYATQFFETNVDGAGTNARGIQWQNPVGQEQEAAWGRDISAPSDGWYTSWKMYLGKSPSGGGSGPQGRFSLAGNNPHQKLIIWLRDDLNANGYSAQRLYLAVTPYGANIRSDDLGYSGPGFSYLPLAHVGELQKWTVFIQPSTGTIKAWVNGVLVLNSTGQNIGSSGLSQVQQTVTTFPGEQQVQYTWDTVVWVPGGGSAQPSTTPVTPPSTKFTNGARIQTTSTLNVRASASATGSLLGSQATGNLGTITGTATYADGYQWWNVNYDSGVDGWSAENFLTSYTAPVVPVASTPTGSTEPVPSGTFMIDTRAGGAQSWQASSVTSIASMNAAAFNDVRNSNGASSFFVDNIDGNGTNARGCQWVGPGDGTEQECVGTFQNGWRFATSSEWVYYQYKTILGKTATGGGNGNVGQYTLVGPNPHQKTVLFLRGRDTPDGAIPWRLYSIMYDGSQRFNIDANNYNGPNWSETPYNYPGTIQRITMGIQGSTGSIKVWRNGNLIQNLTGQPIGNVTFDGVQITATTHVPGQPQVQYDWDHVIWKSGSGGTTPPPAPTSTPTPTPAPAPTPPPAPAPVTLPSTPGSPTLSIQTARTGDSDVKVNWNASSNATSYRYTSGLNSGSTWPGKNGTVSTNSVTLTNVTNGASIWFCVWGVNASGESADSACNSYTVPTVAVIPIPPPVTPPAPTVLPSTKFTNGARVQTTSNLNVRSTASATGSLLGTQATGNLGTIVGTATYADGYQWWNVNYDSGVDGYSAENYLTLSTAPVRLQKPPKPFIFNATPGSVNLSWSSIDYEYCEKIEIYRSTQSAVQTPDPTSKLIELACTDTTYHDQNVTPGTLYYYTLFTVDDLGTYSDPAVLSFTAPAEEPATTSSSSSGGGSSSSSGGSSNGGGGSSSKPPSNTTSTLLPVSNTNYQNLPSVTVKGVELNVRATPSTSGAKLGTQNQGMTGKTIAGPVNASGYLWYYVDFTTAADGWVAGINLNVPQATVAVPTVQVVSPTKTVPLSTKFSIGSQIKTSESVKVRSSAGTGASSLGTQKTGATGKIIAGPVQVNGYIWWNIDYISSPDGWSVDAYLKSNTTPSGSSSTNSVSPSTNNVAPVATSPVGSIAVGNEIVTTSTVNIRNEGSLSATKLGSQPTGARGKVVAGPTLSGGYIWWKIDFISGIDGWTVSDYLVK